MLIMSSFEKQILWLLLIFPAMSVHADTVNRVNAKYSNSTNITISSDDIDRFNRYESNSRSSSDVSRSGAVSNKSTKAKSSKTNNNKTKYSKKDKTESEEKVKLLHIQNSTVSPDLINKTSKFVFHDMTKRKTHIISGSELSSRTARIHRIKQQLKKP